ncbi:MAG: EAL domain-containing protein, partial [Thermoanaerobaculia bacterium]|nr:EAL domain-containing protein [Thermoanaerobaculia bacterium]
MADDEQLDAQELATLVTRLDRQRRARDAAESISEHATGVLYDNKEHLRLLQAVAVAANESPSLDDALQATVDQVCTRLGWPVGHAYLAIGTTSILTLSDIWFVGDLARFETFRRSVETTLVAPSGGVSGKALAQREPVVASSLDGVLPLPLAAAARESGLISALAFPVIGSDAPVAVLEFFSPEPIEVGGRLLEVIAQIGDLLGKVHVRTRTEATLRNSEEQYRFLFEGNPNPMWIADVETFELIAVNDAAVARYGYSRDELLLMTVRQLLAPAPGAAAAPAVRDGAAAILRKDGTVVSAEISGYDIDLPGRRARMTMAVEVDASRRAAEALRESERRFREMLDNIELMSVLLDVVGTVTYCNPYLLRVTGYDKSDVVGRNFFDHFLPEDRRKSVARDYAANIGRGVIASHDESEIVTHGGERRVVVWNNTVLRNSQGSILGSAAIGSDVTEKREAEKQLLHNAFHDSLTELPNRALFLDRVGHALNRVRRDEREYFAVLVLDVDHFKNVNDSLGHAAGDELLVGIGKRLNGSIRAADTVARFGGDEFTILIEKVVDATDATRAAARVQTEIAAPFRVGETDIFTSVSIGIIIAGPEYETPEQILRDADTAMYRAKAQGRGRSEIFDANMRAEVVARLELETDLRRAFDRDELLVHYQPIVRLATGEAVGYEALARWKHPVRGMISPGQFIPIAEETGLIIPIGQLVLGTSCGAVGKFAAGARSVAVNISSRHFAQGDLLSDVRSAIKMCGMSASSLSIEVTESLIMQQPEAALQIMNGLRGLGCRISLDDFGTGYSSLSYLHRFPIDTLKIDASFVRNAARDPKNVEIIRTIISLGKGLGIAVVAEGIETAAERDLLLFLGCEFGQGYLFARPMP